MSVIKKLFAIPSTKHLDKTPKMVWAHKYRGFGEHIDSAEITDMFNFPVGQMSDFKEEVSTNNNNNCVRSTFSFALL